MKMWGVGTKREGQVVGRRCVDTDWVKRRAQRKRRQRKTWGRGDKHRGRRGVVVGLTEMRGLRVASRRYDADRQIKI